MSGEAGDLKKTDAHWARPAEGWLERLSEWVGESCSSIFVKEARQAIKSRHFLWTYFALLVAVGLVAFLGVAWMSGSDSDDAGQTMLFGFLVILGFPLGIIIPFSAYRSLAREFEDGTIQLVSITTMKAYQIILGKFGSAVMQMLVYLSVLAPCILFTYLLRGISLGQILFSLGICVGMSVCLTILGLFLAGAVRSRVWNVGVSVLFVLLLGWLFWLWCMILEELLMSFEIPFFEAEFQFAIASFVSLFGSTALLLLVTASAQISFPSDNRSSRIRWVMVLQQTLFLALLTGGVLWAESEHGGIGTDVEPFVVFVMIAAHYWLLVGFLMLGESPQMSRRVQRMLPQSIVSRSIFSFLMPGPGRGFLFALTMIWSAGLSVIGLMSFFWGQYWYGRSVGSPFPPSFFDQEYVMTIVASLVVCMYATTYLAIGYWVTRLTLHHKVREWPTGSGSMVSLLFGVGIVFLPLVASLTWHFSIRDYSDRGEYSVSQVFNWYWTTFEFFESTPSLNLFWLWLLAGPAAVLVATAMVAASRELRFRPAAVPERVQIDRTRPAIQLPPGESIDEIFGDA